MVGMTGFEPATPSSQARYATKLRYIPILNFEILLTWHLVRFRYQVLSQTILNRLFGRVPEPFKSD